MKKKMQSNVLLLLTAIIWGGGLVAQKAGAPCWSLLPTMESVCLSEDWC